jgi:tetratricopeptide (TPR) repeat protein
MAHLANGEPIPAEDQFRKAIVMDDQYGLAYQGLATALAAQKKNEDAEQMFRRAVELTPRGTDSRLALADLLLRRGQLDEAKAVCSAALEDSPDMANVSIKLAEISAKQQRYKDSLKYCGEAQRLAPYTHPAKVLLAVFCCANGDPKRGIQLLQEARAESPDHPVPALILGQLARQDQRYEEARRHFAEAVSLPIPQNWPGSHKQRYLVLLHSERLRLAESLQDLGLARDALSQWMLCEPNNLKLREMSEELKRAAPDISPSDGTR